ncbi:hypothetical protein XENOCAPTIV_001674 [Xenoophorus captivus]|uniref:Uncharacterized protein n=1 Tax=Xenoophorus captivus TaxID=1517983 RepID=A0ABV0Q8A3_9TELE
MLVKICFSESISDANICFLSMKKTQTEQSFHPTQKLAQPILNDLVSLWSFYLVSFLDRAIEGANAEANCILSVFHLIDLLASDSVNVCFFLRQRSKQSWCWL